MFYGYLLKELELIQMKVLNILNEFVTKFQRNTKKSKVPKKTENRVKNEEQYEALRDKGMSKEKAARIANTDNPNYNSKPYEERTKAELYKQAQKVEIEGRSKMNKNELIEALRNH